MEFARVWANGAKLWQIEEFGLWNCSLLGPKGTGEIRMPLPAGAGCCVMVTEKDETPGEGTACSNRESREGPGVSSPQGEKVLLARAWEWAQAAFHPPKGTRGHQFWQS